MQNFSSAYSKIIDELFKQKSGHEERIKNAILKSPGITEYVDFNGDTILRYLFSVFSFEVDLINFVINNTKNLKEIEFFDMPLLEFVIRGGYDESIVLNISVRLGYEKNPSKDNFLEIFEECINNDFGSE